jgi:hypothetical protein
MQKVFAAICADGKGLGGFSLRMDAAEQIARARAALGGSTFEREPRIYPGIFPVGKRLELWLRDSLVKSCSLVSSKI